MNIHNIKTALDYSYASLQEEYNKRKDELEIIAKKRITFSRAEAMAKNIFTKGELKLSREKQHLLKKKESRITAAREEYKKASFTFDNIKKPSWYQDKTAYLAEQKKVMDMKLVLDQREKDFSLQVKTLDKEIAHLDNLCNSDSGKEQIAEITCGILLKNKPIDDKYLILKTKQDVTIGKMNELKTIVKGVSIQIQTDKGKNITYQVRSSGGGNTGMDIQTIGSSMSNSAMGKLVARFEDDEEIYNGMDSLDIKVARRNHDMGR